MFRAKVKIPRAVLITLNSFMAVTSFKLNLTSRA
jgi:hypothetical protein